MHKIVPNISVDCVIFGFDFNQLNVLLVERKLNDEITGEVIIDDWTLTGYHIYEEETFDKAASRILFDLTGLHDIYLEQFYAFSDLNRISAEKDQIWLKRLNAGFSDRIVTIGYYSLIDNSKVTLSLKDRNVQWFPVDKLPELAFDHKEILNKGLEVLRSKLRFEPIGVELLPEKFSVSQLQKLYEAILGIKIDRRNFRKKISLMKHLIPLNEKQKGVKHKPAQLYIFSRDVYERTKKERLDFII